MLSEISRCRALGSHAGLPSIMLTCILCACSGPKGGALQGGVAIRDSLSCGAAPTADSVDPWLPIGAQYARTAVQGGVGGVWFGQIAGAALVRQRLYVFDGARSLVLVFDDRLTSLADSFGSSGEGPGDFENGGVASQPPEFGPRRWLMPGGPDALIIFDGFRIQRFNADGRYLGLVMSTPALAGAGLSPNTPRFGLAHDSVYFFAGGYDYLSLGRPGSASGNSSPVYYGRVEAQGRRRDLLAMPLPPLPKDRRGVIRAGPRQALPLWALGPRCLWASDGSRPVFYRARRDGGDRDSVVLHLHLPDPLPDDEADTSQELRQMEGPVGPSPKPTALWRIRDLLFDPAGRLWIRLNPEQSSDSTVAVAVLDPKSDETVSFRLPAFPLVFGGPGVFYAVVRDSKDRSLIGRFALSPPPPPSSSSQP